MAEQEILSVQELVKTYPGAASGLFQKEDNRIHAVRSVSFTLKKGETLGLVGESGCGKSTLGKQIAMIEIPDSGSIRYEGHELVGIKPEQKQKIRTDIQMIFQDAYASLNPRKRIYDILSEPLLYHHICSKEEVSGRIVELLGEVGLPEHVAQRYPHEFSGGQRQRICIAKALSLNPKLIVCDEPVSALDVSIQAQILNLLKDLQKKYEVSYLFIAHGLGAVRYISDRIAVMYLGKIVETADSQELFEHPRHPYTKALINASPIADPTRRDEEKAHLEGEIPSAVHIAKGCSFATRCPFASVACRDQDPSMTEEGNGHSYACIHPLGGEV